MKMDARQNEQPATPSQSGSGDQENGQQHPAFSRKDILAVIIAMFQLFLPLIGGLILVGVIVTLIFR